MQKTRTIKNKVYSPEFKIMVVEDMRNNHLGYNEPVRKYWNVTTSLEADNHRSQLRLWERIYLEEGVQGFMVERRGRTTTANNPNKGRPRKLEKSAEEDLIAENQRLKQENEYLQAECEYLKKLDALVRERIERENANKRK